MLTEYDSLYFLLKLSYRGTAVLNIHVNKGCVFFCTHVVTFDHNDFLLKYRFLRTHKFTLVYTHNRFVVRIK